MKYLLPLQVHEHRLSNGLTVWLNEDHTQPKVFGAIVVKAGAVDCPNTGIAHYFEHMMFKGTDKIGTVDYPAEKALLDRIAEKYDALSETTDQAMRAHLQRIINDLSVRAAEYVIPNEFDRLISRYGGTKLNAGTSYDFTVYFNTFSPQYMAHWAELNSERMLNPVFRLFQSELETVYEEKNMYGDFVGSQAIEKLTERYFAPHPYAYPVIGSAEHLKNPRLSEMRRFFETYYVASNMGLVLSGDFRPADVLPLLEASFSRLRDGQAPQREKVELPPFRGKEKIRVKVPVPFVKMMAIGFRGVPADHEDQVALKVAISLLNNANGTGFLDKLTVDHRVVASMAVNESMNEAGILAVVVMPKLLFQSYASAEKLVWKQIERIKSGDFGDETFRSLKLEQKREYVSALEDISSRAQAMMRVYSQGKSWDEYLREIARIDALTKEDVVEAARKYFTGDYLQATKKTGRYPKEHLPKPDYTPVAPKNKDVYSVYVKRLEELPVKEVVTRFVDFEKDVETVSVGPLATLYAVSNPMNDIFTLDIAYGRGVLECPVLTQLGSYLNFIGTDTHPFETFRRKLQALGSTLSFETDDFDFKICISGFEDAFEETLRWVGDWMRQAKADDKKLRQLVDEAKVMENAFFKSSENMAQALIEKVRFGDRSRFLNKLSTREIKKLKGKDLIEVFQTLQTVECHLHYCGTQPACRVAEQMREALPLERIVCPSRSSVYRELETYEKPAVYFLDMPDVSQSIVYAYIKGSAGSDKRTAHKAELFTGYFGGDTSSLMFQEIREFRSYAYRVNARYDQPSVKHRGHPGSFVAMLSTQNDKTADALAVLDGLIREMPEHPERIEAVKRNIRNRVNNDFPPFRKLPAVVSLVRREGYACDPNKELLDDLVSMGMEEVVRFYRENIADRPVVYAVAGDSRLVDMRRLAAFGSLVKVKKKEVFK